MTQGYLIFHLNLAFSSINTEARPDVISKCYWPLLELAEQTGMPIGIELTGWTLQQIFMLDPSWVERLRHLIESKRCELIGSGWAQIIGPLVPYEVNRWNQKLGIDTYQSMLGVKPRLVLVNEMAFSSGMVDVYAEAGYEGIVMDRDNVRLALGLEHTPLSTTPTQALGCGEGALPVLWSDSILFQRLQRAVHGDITVAEYMEYVQQRAQQDDAVLPIYSNDAEIFDYRPGRFTAESRLHQEGEWERFKRVCSALQENLDLKWLSPSQALAIQVANPKQNICRLTSVSQPIPVKKQAKYNINRWAVTGRDDLWINTICHRIHQRLVQKDDVTDVDRRELCELWASDLRTHITTDRWHETLERIETVSKYLGSEVRPGESRENIKPYHLLDVIKLPSDVQITQDDEGILWNINTPNIHLVLNARRGLAIKSLAYRSHAFEPIVGSLSQGYFSTIELGADFYSGGVLMEIPGERNRLTDLEWVTPKFYQQGDELCIMSIIPLAEGMLNKTITVDVKAERIKLRYEFQKFPRPLGIVRVGVITFFPESFLSPLTLSCVNGGAEMEFFNIDQAVNHGSAASTLVSSTAALGATDGRLIFEDKLKKKLMLAWDTSECAAIPVLKHQWAGDRSLTRISFSLCELDDTSRSGGRLMPFSVELTPGPI